MIDYMLPLGTAAIRRAASSDEFRMLVDEGFIGSDAEDTEPLEARLAQAWLYRGLDDEGRPFRDPEGTSRAVVVLSTRAPWAGPNAHNTADFPALQMLVYADCTRDLDGAPIAQDAEDRCAYVANVMHAVFHDAANRVHDWGGLRIISSLGSSGLDLRDVPGTQASVVRGERRYNIVLG